MTRALLLAGLVTCLVACKPIEDDDRPREPVGTAKVDLVDATGDVPSGAFPIEQIWVKVVRLCDDAGLIGKDDCYSELVVSLKAAAERSITLRKRLAAEIPADGDADVHHGTGLALRDRDVVELHTPSASFPWSSANAAQAGTVDIRVAPDGKVTFALASVILADRENTSRVTVAGEVVVDCEPAGDKAICGSMSGPPRP